MIRWLSTNLRTFFWAFLMGLAVWVAAVTASDPDEMNQFPNPIPLEIIGQDPGLVLTGELPQQTTLTLRAPHSVWELLLQEENDIRAILDLSSLDAGEHILNIQLQIPVRPVRVVSMTPASVTVNLEPLASRILPLNLTLSGEPAIGYQAGDAILEPKEVIISGPQSLVSQVDRVRVSINIAGIRESIDQTLNVQALDKNNQIINGVGLNPSEALLKLPISQQGGYRDLAVKVQVQGQVASGYRLTNISVFPPVVTVYSADPSLVNSLPGVLDTTPLNLENAKEDLSTRLAVNLPQGLSLVGEQAVLVQVSVAPIQSSLTLSDKNIEIIGLLAGREIHIAPDKVDVILSGPLPLLDTLTPQDVRVLLDVTGFSNGTYQFEPKVEILVADIVVETILPGTVEVVLSNSDFITPIP